MLHNRLEGAQARQTCVDAEEEEMCQRGTVLEEDGGRAIQHWQREASTAVQRSSWQVESEHGDGCGKSPAVARRMRDAPPDGHEDRDTAG